jgi:cobalt-zinc-cadmium efflux system membrane fusion protein
LLAVALLATASSGCKRSAAERRLLDPPPYSVVSANELRVRPDIFARLTFADASAATSKATARGFGRVVFAPSGSYAVRTSVAGFVEQVKVSIGQEVKAGQSLATIRSGEIARLRADAARLESTIATEEDGVARVTRLIADGAASTRELVEGKGRLEAARAEYAGVRDALSAVGGLGGRGEYFDLRATAPGHVLARNIAPGERLSTDAAEPAFLIGDPKRLLVRGSFPERDVSLLREGAVCRYQLPALGTAEVEGTLANVVRAVDSKTHMAEALCVPKDADPRLAADMTAKIDAVVASNGAVTVPRSAVLMRRDDHVLFVRSGDGLLQRRVVHLGSSIGDDVQILDGINTGERIVVENAILLDGELDRVL